MTEQQEGVLALLEMTQHRLVVETVSELADDLASGSDGAARLHQWLEAYQNGVRRVLPEFDLIKSWERPGLVAFTYDRGSVHSQRHCVIEAILELIMQMAPGRFNKEVTVERVHRD